MYTLVLAPLVHALILRAVHTVKEVGKPPFVTVLRDAEVPESKIGSYEKSRDFVAVATDISAKPTSHTNVIFRLNR